MSDLEDSKKYAAIAEIRTRFGGMFGDQDGIFAGHKFDEDRAKELRRVADKGEVSLDEFTKITFEFFERKGWSQEHRDKQYKKMHKFFGKKLK